MTKQTITYEMLDKWERNLDEMGAQMMDSIDDCNNASDYTGAEYDKTNQARRLINVASELINEAKK